MVLFSAWPFLSFLNTNQDDFYVYGWLIVTYGVTVIAINIALACLFLRFGNYLTVVSWLNSIGVGVILIFLYLPLSYLLSGLGFSLGSARLGIWLFCFLGTTLFVWRISRWEVVNTGLLAVAIVMLTIPVTGLTKFAITGAMQKSVEAPTPRPRNTSIVNSNVYWFVFDGYARQDVLFDYFGVDNAQFVRELELLKFDIAHEAFSNYASTKLSISTTVNMDYYLPTEVDLHPAHWTARLQGFNPVVEYFRQLGYNYVHAEPGGDNLKTRCGGLEDKCIRAASGGEFGVNEAEMGLLGLTPMFPILRRLFPKLISFDFTRLEDIIAQLDFVDPKPKFLFAHVFSPHPPRRFDSDCDYLETIDVDLGGDDYSKAVSSYVSDLTCLNPRIIQMIEKILDKDDTDPFIILQSDHGFRGARLRALVDEPTVPPADVPFANFSAIRLPEACAAEMGMDFTPVNTFRLVFSCIDGNRRHMLPNRHFRGHRGKLEEITFEE